MSRTGHSRSLLSGWRFGCVLVILVAATVSSLFAQNNQYGNIHGAVVDSSGAQMPGIVITLTSPALLAPRSAPSDSGGNYHFEQLPVGIYKIVAQHAGFQQYVRDGIEITAGFSAEVDIQMSVGAQSEIVTVSAESPILD